MENRNKVDIIASFINLHNEKYEICVKDSALYFRGDETDWELTQFTNDYIFDFQESKTIVLILSTFIDGQLIREKEIKNLINERKHYEN
tara:strand:+ start:7008 stop:7274 length:267 start_codon:yes stop_codon:yes gene_type:complete